jgi:hypothetical protein
VLSTVIVTFLFSWFDTFYLYVQEWDHFSLNTTYSSHVLNIIDSNSISSFCSSWYLANSMSETSLLWAILFDEIFVYNSFDIKFIDAINNYFSFVGDYGVLYVDFPDYTYIYKSFIFDFSEDISNIISTGFNVLTVSEDFITVPLIVLNVGFIFFYIFIFASFYFTYYGKATQSDKLIDHDYLLASSTVEAEEEITS